MSVDPLVTRTVEVASTPVGLVVARDDAWSFVATDTRFRILTGSRFRHSDAARSAAERLACLVLDERGGADVLASSDGSAAPACSC